MFKSIERIIWKGGRRLEKVSFFGRKIVSTQKGNVRQRGTREPPNDVESSKRKVKGSVQLQEEAQEFVFFDRHPISLFGIELIRENNSYASEILLGPSLGVSSAHDVLRDGMVDLLGYCR